MRGIVKKVMARKMPRIDLRELKKDATLKRPMSESREPKKEADLKRRRG